MERSTVSEEKGIFKLNYPNKNSLLTNCGIDAWIHDGLATKFDLDGSEMYGLHNRKTSTFKHSKKRTKESLALIH